MLNLSPFSVKEFKLGFNLFKRILGDIIVVKYDQEYIFQWCILALPFLLSVDTAICVEFLQFTYLLVGNKSSAMLWYYLENKNERDFAP